MWKVEKRRALFVRKVVDSYVKVFYFIISNHLFRVTFVMIHFMDVTPIIRQDGLIWFRSFKRVENEGFLIKRV